MTEVTLEGGQKIIAHDEADCVGWACCIHRRTGHHMRHMPQHWRSDRGIMERICEHGCGHPDPDDPTTDRIHGCDGCCIDKTDTKEGRDLAMLAECSKEELIKRVLFLSKAVEEHASELAALKHKIRFKNHKIAAAIEVLKQRT